jgi:hypothetical protein
MDLKQYFASWDAEIARSDSPRARDKPRAAASSGQPAERGYTRRVLRSGCVLICLKARPTPVGFGYRSK